MNMKSKTLPYIEISAFIDQKQEVSPLMEKARDIDQKL